MMNIPIAMNKLLSLRTYFDPAEKHLCVLQSLGENIEQKQLLSMMKPILTWNINPYIKIRRTRSSRPDLEILQNSQENTCARVSILIQFCEISKNTFFTEHLRWLLLKNKRIKIVLALPQIFVGRNSHRRCSVKGVLRNFPKFTGKHLCQSLFFNKGTCQSLFFNKVARLACSFIKKETLVQMFSCEFFIS